MEKRIERIMELLGIDDNVDTVEERLDLIIEKLRSESKVEKRLCELLGDLANFTVEREDVKGSDRFYVSAGDSFKNWGVDISIDLQGRVSVTIRDCYRSRTCKAINRKIFDSLEEFAAEFRHHTLTW